MAWPGCRAIDAWSDAWSRKQRPRAGHWQLVLKASMPAFLSSRLPRLLPRTSMGALGPRGTSPNLPRPSGSPLAGAALITVVSGGSRPPGPPASVQACSPRPEASAVLPRPPSLLHSERSGAGQPSLLAHQGPRWAQGPSHPGTPLPVPGGLPSPVTTHARREPRFRSPAPHFPRESAALAFLERSWGPRAAEPCALNDPCQGLLPRFNYHPGFTSPGAPQNNVTCASCLRAPRPPPSPL